MSSRQRLIPLCLLLGSFGLATSPAFADSNPAQPAVADSASAVSVAHPVANSEDAARAARKAERRRLARLPRPTDPATAADYGS
jgi:hypothetical protein